MDNNNVIISFKHAGYEGEPCDCISRAPTYPVYRATHHLPPCPWYTVEMLEARVAKLEEAVKVLSNME